MGLLNTLHFLRCIDCWVHWLYNTQPREAISLGNFINCLQCTRTSVHNFPFIRRSDMACPRGNHFSTPSIQSKFNSNDYYDRKLSSTRRKYSIFVCCVCLPFPVHVTYNQFNRSSRFFHFMFHWFIYLNFRLRCFVCIYSCRSSLTYTAHTLSIGFGYIP